MDASLGDAPSSQGLPATTFVLVAVVSDSSVRLSRILLSQIFLAHSFPLHPFPGTRDSIQQVNILTYVR